MARKIEWLERVPELLRQLEDFPAPVLDRAALEQWLGLSRRQCIRLMHRWGGYQAGRTFLIGRERMREELEQLLAGEEPRREQRRRQRLSALVERWHADLKGRYIAIPAAAGVLAQGLDSLPAGVRLAPGQLLIDFRDPEQLLERLLALVMGIQNDYGRFEKLAGDTPE